MAEIGLFKEIKEITGNEIILEWKIFDFSTLGKDEFSTPRFAFADASWNLLIEPCNGFDSDECITLGLFNVSTRRPFPLACTFRINGVTVESFKISKVQESKVKELWSFLKFFNRMEFMKRKPELFPDDALTITCTIKIERDNTVPVEVNSMKLTELEKLSDKFKELLASKDTCDTTLQVQGTAFQAHKAVLIASSSVFAAMFKHGMSETQTGVVPITDCDTGSFEEFLGYLYTGRLENVTFSTAFSLYTTSDKYDVQELKAFCLGYMLRSVTADNVCDVAVLADEHDENELFAAAQECFTKNMIKIFETDKWNTLMKENVRLAQKLLNNMASEVALWKKP